MRVVLKSSVACPPFFGTTDDVIDAPEELAAIWIKDGSAELLSDRQQRIEGAKNNAGLNAEVLAEPAPAAGEDPALEGLDLLFGKQNGASAPAADSDFKPRKK